MKYLLALFLFCIGLESSAQNDSLMPNLSASYHVECYNQEQSWPFNGQFDFVNPDVNYDTVEVYFWNQDLLIAELYYDSLKVWIKRISDFDHCYIGWYTEITGEWELLYDYGLTVGDYAYSLFGSEGVITSIEELVVQGEMRKKFIIDDGMDSYIQGVGSVSHPFMPILAPFEEIYQVCGSTLNYFGPSPIDSLTFSPNCNGEILSVENRELLEFNIYPNPSSDHINITLDGIHSGTINIINLSGQILQTHQMNGETLRIDTSELSKGLYFVSLKTASARAIRKVVVAGSNKY